MKKALSLALALAMCLGLTIPAFAAASDFTIDEDGVLMAYVGSDGNITIPEGVVTISSGAFIPTVPVTVTLPSSLELIGSWVFDGCSNLTTITIPTSVAYIGEAAFDNCTSLTDVYYAGSEAQWKLISINDIANDCLLNANIHYSGAGNEQSTIPAYQVSNWAKDRVAVAVENNLAADSLGNDYRVNITRAQFAATAVKLYEAMTGEKLAPVTENPFNDTTDPVILQAADMGFVSGVGSGKFDPGALVTREQAAVMLSSVFTKLGGQVPAVDATSFADNGSVAGWARNAVAFMNSREIITGVGNNNFAPKDNASIEQALLIALKMYETLK